MASNKGLGKGLGALLGDFVEEPQEDSAYQLLPIYKVEPNPDQPRQDFDEEELQALADSITEHGIIQPLTVRQMPNGYYQIIAGERRWRAARLAGLSEVPVVIKDVTDAEAMELALIENLQREDLDPVEEAMGYRQLMERCELTQEQTAQKIGKSRSAIANSLRLLNLPEDVLAFLKEGKLSTGHAKVLLGLPDAALQSQAAEAVVGQNLNVRQTEALCKKLVKPEKPAKPQPLRPALAGEVEYALRQVLGSEVKVDYKNGQGSLTVHFYSDEQLSAFANLLGGYNKEENK